MPYCSIQADTLTPGRSYSGDPKKAGKNLQLNAHFSLESSKSLIQCLTPQALVDAAKQQLLTNRSQLHNLSNKCGVAVQEDARVLNNFSLALKSWDQQSAQHKVQDMVDQSSSAYMTRDELNKALAGSMIAR